MKITTNPSRSQFAVLRQICNLIPSHLVPKLARETGVHKKARTFSPWSHLLKAYVDFAHLFDLFELGVFWVTGAKDNMVAQVLHSLPVAGRILSDEIISLRNPAARADYPELMRRITALVEIDGREQELVFLTNNMEWSPASVADLYRCRWSIEAFLKHQADAPACRFPGAEHQRGALAGLDGPAGLCAPAFSGFRPLLESQL